VFRPRIRIWLGADVGVPDDVNVIDVGSSDDGISKIGDGIKGVRAKTPPVPPLVTFTSMIFPRLVSTGSYPFQLQKLIKAD